LTELPSNSIERPKGRRWSVIAAGLLLAALALVVLYTSRPAFSSPIAMVVVGAIGFAALVLQLRLRKQSSVAVLTPLWLNIVAILCAVTAIFADLLHLGPVVMLASALGAVICFAVSGIVMLRAVRKG
jgi:hypothetical protein